MTRAIRYVIFTALLATGCARPIVGRFETSRRDVTYVTRDTQDIKMTVFSPKGATGPRPALLWLHGGGWRGGARGELDGFVQLTASFGYVAATADYRLTNPKVHFPLPLQDCVAALRYLRAHAAELNIDPDRIAVGGDSAGGHLALLVGTVKDESLLGGDPSANVSAKVSGVIDVYGPTDLPVLYKIGMPFVRELMTNLMGTRLDQDPAAWHRASPIDCVSADAPPTLIVHGDSDPIVIFSQSEIYRDKCREVGSYCELIPVPHAGHGWIGDPKDEVFRSSVPVILHFLARLFPEPVPTKAAR